MGARRTLFVMVKEPQAGRVKTRLGREIGYVDAAWWFRHQSGCVLRRLRDPRWQLVLAVSPDRCGIRSAFWPSWAPRVPQGGGDLGARMARLLRRAPAGPVCVVGADIPALSRDHVARAFGLLGRQDAVFGPATDGGFWLVGLKRMRAVPPGIFAGVRWSSEHALADSRASLPGHRIALADELQDVDSRADLVMTLSQRRDSRVS